MQHNVKLFKGNSSGIDVHHTHLYFYIKVTQLLFFPKDAFVFSLWEMCKCVKLHWEKSGAKTVRFTVRNSAPPVALLKVELFLPKNGSLTAKEGLSTFPCKSQPCRWAGLVYFNLLFPCSFPIYVCLFCLFNLEVNQHGNYVDIVSNMTNTWAYSYYDMFDVFICLCN